MDAFTYSIGATLRGLASMLGEEFTVPETSPVGADGFSFSHNAEMSKLGILEASIPDHIPRRIPNIADLPPGIAIMGGVSRSVAREMLSGKKETIRDIDLVNIIDFGTPSHETLDALSKKYMPDDFSHGHGINRETLRDYFETRDFTANECLIMDGKIYVTQAAHDDIRDGVIRPTAYELDGGISSRLYLKGLRMEASLAASGIAAKMQGFGFTPWCDSFDIALQLNKAMSQGAHPASVFTERLSSLGLIDKGFAGRPIALAKSLMGDLYSFAFRDSTWSNVAAKETADAEASSDLRDASDKFLSLMESFHATGEIRDAIGEYDDATNKSNTKEQDVGKYDASVWEEINAVQNDDDRYYYGNYDEEEDYDDEGYEEDYDDEGYDEGYDDDEYNDYDERHDVDNGCDDVEDPAEDYENRSAY